ncbi:hypothetical protein GCM10023185_04510 [Hymenobacter saemangeumensis]|uniref:Lipocalin-like domain-containing protein n=1 Tax=Hymenobacter saemangeumensis TaxID=1084522 RepID=A0ABP8I0A6_9BACT
MKNKQILFVGLLLTAACTKKTVEPDKPEPRLEGRWQESSHLITRYDAAGNIVSQDVDILQGYYMVLTKDSLHYRTTSDHSSLGSDHYVRQGNVLQFGRGRISPVITTLTEHALSLRFRQPAATPGGGYIDSEDRYTH